MTTFSDELPPWPIRGSDRGGAGSADMPRYFFHIEGEKPHHDEVGKELADDGAAWAQAVRMLRHTENGMQPGDNWTLRVFNGEKPIYVIAVVSQRY